MIDWNLVNGAGPYNEAGRAEFSDEWENQAVAAGVQYSYFMYICLLIGA